MSKKKFGDKVMIKIGNRKIETYIDKNGIQRIVPVNRLYNHLYNTGKIDLNDLAISYAEGKFSFKEYLDINLSIDYSVCGFSELHNFEHLKIKNPLWDE